MLHDHDIEAVEDFGCRHLARNRACHQLVHDPLARRRLIEHPHDGDLIARQGQVGD